MRAVWFVTNVGIEELDKSGNEDVLLGEGVANTSGGKEISK